MSPESRVRMEGLLGLLAAQPQCRSQVLFRGCGGLEACLDGEEQYDKEAGTRVETTSTHAWGGYPAGQDPNRPQNRPLVLAGMMAASLAGEENSSEASDLPKITVLVRGFSDSGLMLRL